MLWCHGAQNIGLSDRKLKSALKCTIWSQCRPIPGRQADGHTDRPADRKTDRRTSCQ